MPAKLTIVFRYLMLYYLSPNGVKVLVPSAGHRTFLRDTRSDSVLHLSQASLKLVLAGEPRSERTSFDPDGRLISLDDLLKRRVAPQAILDEARMSGVPTQLNALVELPGGHLKAYPPEAFPELANTVFEFTFGMLSVCSMVTDTAVYSIDLPELAPGETHELVVTSERQTVRIDVSQGGRFELRNVDEKVGKIVDEDEFHSQELQTILDLIDPGNNADAQCDEYVCGEFYCGDGN